MFNYFTSATQSSLVQGSVEADQFFDYIQNGNEALESILRARESYEVAPGQYTAIKKAEIPCYALNFQFDGKRGNQYITNSTGYIYLDVDGRTDVDLKNPLVHASWLSLSGTGIGLLVKVEGMTPSNYSIAYYAIAEELGIKADPGACKASQVNILSYDPDLYVNDQSLIWELKVECSVEGHFIDNITPPPELVENEMTATYYDIRWDNQDLLLNGIDFDGELVYDFQEKRSYSKVIQPFNKIPFGKRNSTLNAIAYQIRSLNPSIYKEHLVDQVARINNESCEEPIPYKEVIGIVSSVMKIPNSRLQPVLNKERRFLFNPDYELTTTEKRKAVARRISKDKEPRSRMIIEKTIREWDFKADGTIYKSSLGRKTGMAKNTIKKYYPEFKAEIDRLNAQYGKS